MHRLLNVVGLCVVLVACSTKDETSASAGPTTTTGVSDSTGGTDATSGSTSASTTTATTVSTSTTPTTEATSGSSGGCGGVIGCGISVEGPTAVCDKGDPIEASTGGTTGGDVPSLTVTPLGGGKVDVSEVAFSATCCLTLTPEISVDGASIAITYAESGEPCDCICSYTIHFTLVDVPVGAWTIVSGSLSAEVDVT